MPHTLRLIALALFALGTSRCAFPHGSLARPIDPAAEGTTMLSGGLMVPFANAVSVSAGDTAVGGAATADAYFLIPSTAVSYAFGSGSYFTLEASAWTTARLVGSGKAGFESLIVFLNPAFEVPLDEPDRRLSLTIDVNLAYIRNSVTDQNGARQTIGTPFFSPNIGIKWYIPTGFGGLIFSQQVGTAIFTTALPGSLAYDIPIPISEGRKLHLFPEVRWDPTFILIGDAKVSFSFFSGGLSLMLEL